MTSPAIKPTLLISLKINIYIFMCMGVLPRCMFVYHLRAVSIKGWSKLGLELQTYEYREWNQGVLKSLSLLSCCNSPYPWPHFSGVLLIFPFFPEEGSFSALFSYYLNCVCLISSQYVKLVNSWGWEEDRTRSLVRVTNFDKSLAQIWI